jgi:2-keto-4-pentenoate hydratase/2-oxohepta-3-ene-1,7-dioic acid hydratase in catechol pathway
MRFVRYDDGQLGLLTDDGNGIISLSDRLGLEDREPLIEYMEGDHNASEYSDADPDHDVADIQLESPVNRPGKVIAAPLNYESHIEEAISDRDITTDEWFSIKDKGYFLKASSSVVGPDHGIELPFSDRRTDHEIELAFVMGSDVKNISAKEAWDNVFGYTILLDISLRGDQDRSNRKSYDTFTVIGPCVRTADEIADPQNLQMELTLNGQRRQYENTGDMVYTCADIVQYASLGTTLETGDIVTTGTPEGVSELSDGDTIEAEIEGIGSMTVDVTERELNYVDADVEKGGTE